MLATNLLALVLFASSSLAAPTRTGGGEALAARAPEHGEHHHYNVLVDTPAPSSSPSGGSRKRSDRATIPITLGLGHVDPARCPSGMMACPVTTMTPFEAANVSADEEFDCVEWQDDLYSCGGCSTMGTGIDCTALPGVSSVGCSAGACHAKPGARGFLQC
ncbi:hypothetical protein EHS25_008399 [Saitozyma podzolica]|uniref:Protein CPL1-like domain-containing protein n=1 Tax=Saitozyma podzolica TaxID=1890683 RepID=A0A427YPE5_9TREE|nr:hypothetical protein EHS25_008399 [Saitozyma podzolica]